MFRPDRHGSPRRPRRSNLTILSDTFGQIKFAQKSPSTAIAGVGIAGVDLADLAAAEGQAAAAGTADGGYCWRLRYC